MYSLYFIYIPLKAGRVYGALAKSDGIVLSMKICSSRSWLKTDLLFNNPDAQKLVAKNGISLEEAKRSNQEIRAESVSHLISILQKLRDKYDQGGA